MPSKGRRDVLAKKAMAEGSSSPMGIKIITTTSLFLTQYFPNIYRGSLCPLIFR
jgi:hypothetical protein